MRQQAVAALLLLASCSGQASQEDLPRVAARSDWALWPAGSQVGEVSAVDVDSHGHVFVLHRPGRDWAEPFPTAPIANPTVAVFDTAGTLVAQWGVGETVMPHGLSVSPDDSVWITDAQREQLLHLSHDGALIETRGERGVTGSDSAHFGRPTDAAATPSALYVADGYLNHRILRIAGSVSQWGGDGEGEAGLRVPHSVAVFDGQVIV
ncbi:MAG: 6-bladed beta-propeller, partial [Sphingomonadales bacterium]